MMWVWLFGALLAVPRAVCPGPASAETIEETFATCTACHGEDGLPIARKFPSSSGSNRAISTSSSVTPSLGRARTKS